MRVFVIFALIGAVVCQEFLRALPSEFQRIQNEMEETEREMMQMAETYEMVARQQVGNPAMAQLQIESPFGDLQAAIIFEAPQVQVVTHEVHQEQRTVNGQVVVETEVLDCVGNDCQDRLTVEGHGGDIVVSGPGPVPTMLRGVAEALATAKQPCHHDASAMAEAPLAPAEAPEMPAPVRDHSFVFLGSVCVFLSFITAVSVTKCRGCKSNPCLRELAEPLAPEAEPWVPSETHVSKTYVHRLYARAAA